MPLEFITREDLHMFQHQLIRELKQVISTGASVPLKRWVKSKELSKLLKVSASTLQTLRINGTLQYTKIGGIIYYDLDHVEKLMKENLRVAKEN